ncbi:NAD(P)-dependent oxidoreductase [Chitinophaga sp. 30R24]|uniref:NAD(P)-dependent oxidoreductase n=1 Tax=Chitinophaga sp. 30R24 TaxID=3248838 RepID=UPI003B91D1C1
MNITIIGASAGVGLITVTKALAKGHHVTALSRNTATIPDHPLLKKIDGSSTSSEDLKNAVQGADAIIITIGTKQKKGTTLFSDTAKALIKITDASLRTKPVLVVSGFGTGDSSPYLSFFMRTVIRLFLKDQYEDKTKMEILLAGSPLKWEIVRPGILSDGPATDNYEVINTLYKGMKIGKISRNDVADFLLREAENPKMLHQYPALNTKK